MSTYNSRTADKFVVRMPDGMRDSVDSAASEQHIRMNTFIVQAISEKLDREQRAKVAVDTLVAAAQAAKAGDA